MHSGVPAGHHALTDGNKRLALAAAIAFYGLNGRRLTLTSDQDCTLVISVAEGKPRTADTIAATVTSQPRQR